MISRTKPSICGQLLPVGAVVCVVAACGRTDPDSLLLTPATGGSAALPGVGGWGSGGAGGSPTTGGAGTSTLGGSSGVLCGPVIDDMEDGDGYICRGEGRVGAWYAVNDGSGSQWPALRPAGDPIETSEIPGGRAASRRAVRTYGGDFSGWGAGIGADLAFDGTRYGSYDASAYDGIQFYARAQRGPLELEVRIGTTSTTSVEHGGTCEGDACAPRYRRTTVAPGWNLFEVPFSVLAPTGAGPLEQRALSNIEFRVSGYESFDFWIDDLAFYAGDPACCGQMPAACGRRIQLADPELAEELGRGSLACEEVCTLSALDAGGTASSGPITSLEGLECFSGLIDLRLASRGIVELSSVGGLARLVRLDLATNQVEDISPLLTLTELVFLDLSDNPLGDVSALSRLSNLRELDLSGAQLASVEGVGELGQLTSLDLAENRITITSPLAGLSSIVTLDLSGNQLVDVAGLSGLTTLSSLDISRNSILRADDLAPLRGLTALDVADNRLTGVGFVRELTSLTSLSFTGNQVTDLGPVASLTALESLHAAENQLIDLTPLSRLPNLRDLELAGNGISDLSPLGSLEILTTLRLARNQISDVRPLAALTGLTNLELSGNQLSNVFALAELRNLELLTLTDNQISDLSQFIGFGGLRPAAGETAMLYLDGNPIDCAGQADVLEALRARGLTVIVDCD